MDGTPLTVTSTSMLVPIEADGFRVFGNKQALLSQPGFSKASTLLYPNPSNGNFYINTNVQNVSIYAVTGQLVKEFKGNFEATHSYPTADLNQGIYLVKITDENHKQSTVKWIKK